MLPTPSLPPFRSPLPLSSPTIAERGADETLEWVPPDVGWAGSWSNSNYVRFHTFSSVGAFSSPRFERLRHESPERNFALAPMHTGLKREREEFSTYGHRTEEAGGGRIWREGGGRDKEEREEKKFSHLTRLKGFM